MIAEHDFRRLLAAQWVAQAADGVAQAAFAVDLVLDPVEAGTPTRILGLFAFSLVPYSVIAPFLGVFVDRWSRRSLLTWTNAARAVLLTALAVLSLSGPAGEPVLYAGVLAVLGLGRLFLTTKGAALPVVLHEQRLLAGNALSGGGGLVSALLGGVLGLVAADVIDTDGTFAVAGLAYALSAIVAGTLSSPLAHRHPKAEGIGEEIVRVARELGDGLRTVMANVRARLALFGIFCLRTAGMIVVVAAILIIKQRYPGADDRSERLAVGAYAVGAAGVGAFAAAVIAPALGRRLGKPKLMLAGFAISGIGITSLGGLTSLPAVLTLTLIGGFAGFLAKVTVDAQLQEALPDDHRGRAFALYDILYNLASVAAAGFIVIFQSTPLRPLLVAAGAGTLVLAALMGAALAAAGLLTGRDEETTPLRPGR